MSAFCTKREGFFFFFFFLFSRFKKAHFSFFTDLRYFSSNLKRTLYLNFLLASRRYLELYCQAGILLPARALETLENEVPRHGVLGLRARLGYLKLDSVVHYHRSIHCLPYFYLGRYLEEEEEEKRIISKRNFCRNNY